MEQLQQANSGTRESIDASVNAAQYAPLKYQMDLGTKLMEQGLEGASMANRQAMSEQGAMDRERLKYSEEHKAAKAADEANYQSYRGSLTQALAEFDDFIDNADPEDPAVQERMPAVVRKREQLQQLLDAGKSKNANYLGGILKYGTATGMLNPNEQAAIAEKARKPEEGHEKTKESKDEPKKQEDTNHDHPSENVIHL